MLNLVSSISICKNARYVSIMNDCIRGPPIRTWYVDLKDLCGFPLNPNDFYVSSRRPLLLTENCTNHLHSKDFAFIDRPRPDKCAVLFDNPSRPQYHYTTEEIRL